MLHGVGPTPVAPYMRDGPFAPCPKCFTMVRHADRLQDDEPSQGTNTSSSTCTTVAAGSDSGSGKCVLTCLCTMQCVMISALSVRLHSAAETVLQQCTTEVVYSCSCVIDVTVRIQHA